MREQERKGRVWKGGPWGAHEQQNSGVAGKREGEGEGGGGGGGVLPRRRCWSNEVVAKGKEKGLLYGRLGEKGEGAGSGAEVAT